MTFSRPLLLIATVAGIAGCSGPGPKREPPKLTETFSTNITANGSKMFEYAVVAQRPENGGGPRSGGRGGPPGGGEGGRGGPPGGDESGRGGGQRRGGGDQEAGREDRSSELYENLAAKLEETGYCREGYLELEGEFGRSRSRVRGECRETATDEDRENFPNSVAVITEDLTPGT